MMPEDAKAKIVENVHQILDVLRENPDRCLSWHCEQILNRLDIMAGANMEDYE